MLLNILSLGSPTSPHIQPVFSGMSNLQLQLQQHSLQNSTSTLSTQQSQQQQNVIPEVTPLTNNNNINSSLFNTTPHSQKQETSYAQTLPNYQNKQHFVQFSEPSQSLSNLMSSNSLQTQIQSSNVSQVKKTRKKILTSSNPSQYISTATLDVQDPLLSTFTFQQLTQQSSSLIQTPNQSNIQQSNILSYNDQFSSHVNSGNQSQSSISSSNINQKPQSQLQKRRKALAPVSSQNNVGNSISDNKLQINSQQQTNAGIMKDFNGLLNVKKDFELTTNEKNNVQSSPNSNNLLGILLIEPIQAFGSTDNLSQLHQQSPKINHAQIVNYSAYNQSSPLFQPNKNQPSWQIESVSSFSSIVNGQSDEPSSNQQFQQLQQQQQPFSQPNLKLRNVVVTSPIHTNEQLQLQNQQMSKLNQANAVQFQRQSPKIPLHCASPLKQAFSNGSEQATSTNLQAQFDSDQQMESFNSDNIIKFI